MDNREARLQRDIATVRFDEENTPLPKGMIAIGSDSIIGTRKTQQDSFYIGYREQESILVICDGMGGMEGGERASQTAIRMMAEDFDSNTNENIPDFFEQEAIKIDDAVHSLKKEDGQRMNGGTTMVAVVIRGDELYWLSVGDSRIYILRNQEMVQVNRDHNYKLRLDEQLKEGLIDEDTYLQKLEKGEALISYLGMGNVSLMDINQVPFQLMDSDVLLLCSDGLYKRMTDQDIMEIIREELPDVDEAAKALTRVVMERTIKSQDNTTVIVMQYSRIMDL